MSKILVDCETGISGDMVVAALLDLGADREAVEKALSGLTGEGIKTAISRKKRGGIDCCDFDVILEEKHANFDHDMEYLYGHNDSIHHNGTDDHSGHNHSHEDLPGGHGGAGEGEDHGH